MNRQDISRRGFLFKSGRLLGAGWVSTNLPVLMAVAQTACSRRDDGTWVNISAGEAAGFGAIVDQIVPPDETAGATEAGVVNFLDAALEDFLDGMLPKLQEGLDDLDRRAGGRFAELDFDQQTRLLEEIEETPFFQNMQFITFTGLLAMPDYGGNRDLAGWKLIGFDHRHAWQAPFGHYDAAFAKGEGADDES